MRFLSFVSLLAVLAIAVLGGTPASGWESIDLGSPIAIEVHPLYDPLSLIRIPPGAFGNHPPGTTAWIDIDIPSCSAPYCLGGRQYLVSFDDGCEDCCGGCTGGGALVGPITIQISYDEADVRGFGIDEEDVVLAGYDANQGRWVPLPDQTVDVEQNVVSAPENETIRVQVGVFAAAPQPVAPASWGRIKALFGGSAR